MKTLVRGVGLAVVVILTMARAHASSVPFSLLGDASNYNVLALGGIAFATGGVGWTSTNASFQTTNIVMLNHSQVVYNTGMAGNGTTFVDNSNILGNASAYNTGTITLTNTGTTGANDFSGNNTTWNNTVNFAMNTYRNIRINATWSAQSAGMTNAPGNAVAESISNGSTTTIIGAGGSSINVLNLTSLTLSNASTLMLSGTSTESFIITVSGNFTLDGGSNLQVEGGLLPSNVIYEVQGCGQTEGSCTVPSSPVVQFGDGTRNSYVVGTILAPFRDITVNMGTVNGELISGNLNITLMNQSKVLVPEPGTILILTSGLAALGMRFRRR